MDTVAAGPRPQTPRGAWGEGPASGAVGTRLGGRRQSPPDAARTAAGGRPRGPASAGEEGGAVGGGEGGAAGRQLWPVVAGLAPAIHVFTFGRIHTVDARQRPGMTG